MHLYNIGKSHWKDTQLIYHALAELGRESLVLISPSTPYVCIGYHQDVRHEVDMEYCKKNAIPVFRRQVGGGAVYLDGNQFFFHLVLQKDNPVIPLGKDAFYRKFLQPIVDVYQGIGIPAKLKPVNDIIANNRKISGTGVGEIGDCIVFVGNLILDFNYAMMSRILKVPDEKFRHKVKKTIEENLSTIRRELGEEKSAAFDEEVLNQRMVEAFSHLTGEFSPRKIDSRLREKMDEMDRLMMNDDWLYEKGKSVPGRSVKIRSQVSVSQRIHKATGGLIRADFETRDGRFENISISGDFFCYPPQAVSRLETILQGCSVKDVENVLTDFYETENVETPEVEINDWLKVLKV